MMLAIAEHVLWPRPKRKGSKINFTFIFSLCTCKVQLHKRVNVQIIHKCWNRYYSVFLYSIFFTLGLIFMNYDPVADK